LLNAYFIENIINYAQQKRHARLNLFVIAQEFYMKIALVWPKGFNVKTVIPLSLGYLKSNIDNKKHDVRIFDFALSDIDSESSKIEEMVRDFNPQILGISSWTVTYAESFRILERIKSIDRSIMTVIGGVHATTSPGEVMKNKNVDFLFRGEAELRFSEFVDEVQKEIPNYSKIGNLTYRTGSGDIINNELVWEKELDKIKIPDYDAIRLEDYIKRGYRYESKDGRNAPIFLTRGCPYQCDFCSASILNGRIIRYHSKEYLAKWVTFLYREKHIKTINIIDDNFTFDRQYAKECCDTLIGLKLKGLHFGTPNGIRIERTDKELFKMMKQAGWENITIAPESGSIKTLKRMKKNLDPAIVPQKVKEIKEAGLKAIGFFIVGYPGETSKDIEDTVRLIRKCRFDFFLLHNFQPLPGTPVYTKLVEEGSIPATFFHTDYHTGKAGYVPEELKDFSFSFLRIREYLYLAVTNPLSVIYVLKNFDLGMIFRRVLSNLMNMFAI